MKTRVGAWAVFALVSMATVAQATIQFQLGDKVYYERTVASGAYWKGNGGEFFIQAYTWGSSGYDPTTDWLTPAREEGYTFCAELGQYITEPMYVYAIDPASNSRYPSRDISDFGQWVYYAYSVSAEPGNKVPDRVLSSSNFIHSNTDAGMIQYALWRELGFSADEIASSGGISPTDQELFLATVGSATSWESGDGTWYDAYKSDTVWARKARDRVKIAWMTTNSDWQHHTGTSQDQFMFIPGDLGEVPEPASMVVWSLIGGCGAAAALASRRRRGRWSEETRQAIASIIERGNHV